MLLFVIKRIAQAMLVFLAITVIVFSMLHAAGDPVAILMPPEATVDQIEQMRRQLGLDRPLYVQYGKFLFRALHGDLGVSYYHGAPAFKMVIDRLPASLELVTAAMVISIVLALPFGIWAGLRPRSLVDKSSLLVSLAGLSAPPFWIGIVCILIFSVELNLLPSSGRGTWAHLVLPAGSLAVYRLALFVRLIRAGMMDVLSQDYIRTARAKGLPELFVVYKHALKNTMIPFVTIAGMQMGSLLAGAIVTEKVFAWPGMGRLFLDSIGRMDFPVIVAWTIVTAAIFLSINTIVDILYVWMDPRIRHDF